MLAMRHDAKFIACAWSRTCAAGLAAPPRPLGFTSVVLCCRVMHTDTGLCSKTRAYRTSGVRCTLLSLLSLRSALSTRRARTLPIGDVRSWLFFVSQAANIVGSVCVVCVVFVCLCVCVGGSSYFGL